MRSTKKGFGSRHGPRLLASLLLALLPLICPSCIVLGWPPLPPTTYHGRVVDQHSRPVAGVEVKLLRPGVAYMNDLAKFTEYPSEEIGKTYTARDGTFVVKTRAGYATEAAAALYDTDPHSTRYIILTGYLGNADEPGKAALPKELFIKVQ